ncbi:MAG: HAMP domain-containing histidine kinase [Deltaproteobacteria bacterium]|nr:HAMP domain-containing histidine kinase [Deltaproteobacteria bacterium]
MELRQSFHPLEGELRAERGTLSEIAAQRNLTEALAGGKRAESSWGFAQILEHIDVGILVLDLHRRAIDYRNPLFDQVLQDDQLCSDFQALYDLLLKELEDTNRLERAAYVNHQVNYQGRLLGCSIYKTASRYRCIFLRDITEKAHLESIAQAVNAMDSIGFIFSGIRHEIGNPLNSLKMALSVLKQNLDTFSLATIGDYVDRGLADIGRMEYLLKALKTFSLYDQVDLKDLSLAEFMNKFLSLIKRDFQSHGIRILLAAPLDTTRVRIDKRALHQALLNIFNNAAEALMGQDDAEICIQSERRGQLIWLTISDNGSGISPEQQKYLFQPFNTSKPNGNGLGLVITRKLLAMMNSDIDIDSELQRGTRVTISLPVSAAEESAAVSTKSEGGEFR